MTETWEERIARENAERNAKHAELRELAGRLTLAGFTLVPPVLDPDSSSFDRYYRVVKLAHKDGREVWLNWSSERGKITASGYLPHGWYNYKPYDAKLSNIRFSGEKTAETITKEIERRLLPNYTAIFEQCRERVNEADDYEAASDKTIRAVAKAFRVEIRKPSHAGSNWNGRVREVSWYNSDCPSGDAKASRDRIELQLTGLTVAQCEAIAKIVCKK